MSDIDWAVKGQPCHLPKLLLYNALLSEGLLKGNIAS